MVKTVILAGNPTNLLSIKQLISQELDFATVLTADKPEEILVYGAACQAAQVDGQKTRSLNDPRYRMNRVKQVDYYDDLVYLCNQMTDKHMRPYFHPERYETILREFTDIQAWLEKNEKAQVKENELLSRHKYLSKLSAPVIKRYEAEGQFQDILRRFHKMTASRSNDEEVDAVRARFEKLAARPKHIDAFDEIEAMEDSLSTIVRY